MSGKPASGKFTGRHMAIIMVAGFGIVIAVNAVMATVAVGGFHGVVVDNSYVASQQFNGWLDNAAKARALGWQVMPERAATGHVLLRTKGVPAGTGFTAALRRPLGDKDFAELTFRPVGEGLWQSDQTVAPGRWIIRLTAEAEGIVWAEESDLQP
ncbi:MAG: FixH family protein [Porphyrobacter sp.]|jgi:nitrogen fixation protein FixH|nr:FixH family protein [Porphyrobacter sp.]